MKSGLYSLRSMVLVLLFVLTVPRGVRAQEGETTPPRDTLIAAARQVMESARFCALITLDKSGHPRARAMDPFSPEEDMTVWLGTNRRTRKVQDIKNDSRVTLFYLDPEGKELHPYRGDTVEARSRKLREGSHRRPKHLEAAVCRVHKKVIQGLRNR
jgi:hypothetical protein